MKTRLFMPIAMGLALLLGLPVGAHAADKIKAVASFSILGDIVREVGGDRVEVTTLVGPDGDAHVYEPTPADARNLAASNILFVNGLGFEGWMDRLEKSSGFKGPVLVASKGVTPRHMMEDEDGKQEEITDPHAWQSLANGKIYVANIRDGLIATDPEGKAAYEANAAAYLDAIATEEAAAKAARIATRMSPDTSSAQKRAVIAGSSMMPTASRVPSAWKPLTRLSTTSTRKRRCVGPLARLTERKYCGSKHSSTSGR